MEGESIKVEEVADVALLIELAPMKPDPLPAPNAELGKDVLGSWRLVSRDDYDREGRKLIDPILGADPLGMLTFAPGHFAAQFMNRRRGEKPFETGTQASSLTPGSNNSSAVDGYDAYFGTYEIDAREGTVAVSLQGALSPANIGLNLKREIRVADGQLLIRLATTAADGTPITRTLTFERIA